MLYKTRCGFYMDQDQMIGYLDFIRIKGIEPIFIQVFNYDRNV